MTDLASLTDRWATAERTLDRSALEPLLASDFRGVGPHGFVLDRDGWLDRLDADAEVEELELRDLEERPAGDVTLVTAVQSQRAAYRGHRSDDRFRLLLVVASADDGPRVLHAQLSGPLPA